ncbi:MAG: DUF1232 domain-containing protein [Anaerolineae bacterium]|nr:DUF1232 domain-containing protein [Thermoflexales bacterium]MDW8407703.1 DUF1232 domain-containing protein [Anaerolineae bacterium]
MLERWKAQAARLKTETYALYLAYRDPRTPWFARVVAALVVAYAFSPIDLIPDVIPVLGYMDDLIVIPLGVTFALRLIPDSVLRDSRAQAQEIMRQGRPVSRAAAVVIVLIWLLLAAMAVALVVRVVRS